MLKKVKRIKNNIIYRLFSEPFKKIIREEIDQVNLNKILNIVSTIESNIFELRNKLIEVRRSSDYLNAFEKKNPLVTVRIATFNRSSTLLNKTLPSVLNQTYKNIEIIIVGDNCTDDTEEKIKKLKIKKVKFFNMPYRGYYPKNKLHKWYVASTTPANDALQKSKGLWVCPFDDDDEMVPDHIEKLLKKAQKEKLEFVYGKALSVDKKTLKETNIGSFPPKYGHISLNSSIIHGKLIFFEYDLFSWTVNEPGDWNLIKKLMQCGVYIGYVNSIITKINFVHPNIKTKGLHKKAD